MYEYCCLNRIKDVSPCSTEPSGRYQSPPLLFTIRIFKIALLYRVIPLLRINISILNRIILIVFINMYIAIYYIDSSDCRQTR